MTNSHGGMVPVNKAVSTAGDAACTLQVALQVGFSLKSGPRPHPRHRDYMYNSQVKRCVAFSSEEYRFASASGKLCRCCSHTLLQSHWLANCPTSIEIEGVQP